MARILVVEDDFDLLFVYHLALTQQGHEIIKAENASIALSEINARVFDAIILDLNLPDAYGTVVIDHVLQDVRHSVDKIIVVTATDHQLGEVISRGVQHIRGKPISISELIELVATVVN